MRFSFRMVNEYFEPDFNTDFVYSRKPMEALLTFSARIILIDRVSARLLQINARIA